jgi:hypothetical protein
VSSAGNERRRTKKKQRQSGSERKKGSQKNGTGDDCCRRDSQMRSGLLRLRIDGVALQIQLLGGKLVFDPA